MTSLIERVLILVKKLCVLISYFCLVLSNRDEEFSKYSIFDVFIMYVLKLFQCLELYSYPGPFCTVDGRYLRFIILMDLALLDNYSLDPVLQVSKLSSRCNICRGPMLSVSAKPDTSREVTHRDSTL